MGEEQPSTTRNLSPRQEMALLVRILARLGYDDKLAGHVSLRDSQKGTLLVTPVGFFWDELRASQMLRIDEDGNLLEGNGRLNPTIVFHVELHRARPDIRVALHNHPPYGTIWAAAGELPPLLDQTGCSGGGRATLCREYDGAVISSETAADLARSYGDADMAILAQHGTLVTGASVPEVLVRALSFEWRCQKAFEVHSMGKKGEELPLEVADSLSQYAEEYGEMLFEAYGRKEFKLDPGLLD